MATELMKKAWRSYCNSEVEYLCGENSRCAYSRCSAEKWRAWDYCKKLMDKHGGWGLRIIGANTFVFSCGFVFEDDNGEKKFMYITPSHNRECYVKEIEGENR